MSIPIGVRALLGTAILGLFALLPPAVSAQATKPTTRDKCPVCGALAKAFKRVD